MYIPDSAVKGLYESTRPIVVYRNGDGSFKCGFVMRCDEFVTSLRMMNEVRKAAGLPILDLGDNPL